MEKLVVVCFVLLVSQSLLGNAYWFAPLYFNGFPPNLVGTPLYNQTYPLPTGSPEVYVSGVSTTGTVAVCQKSSIVTGVFSTTGFDWAPVTSGSGPLAGVRVDVYIDKMVAAVDVAAGEQYDQRLTDYITALPCKAVASYNMSVQVRMPTAPSAPTDVSDVATSDIILETNNVDPSAPLYPNSSYFNTLSQRTDKADPYCALARAAPNGVYNEWPRCIQTLTDFWTYTGNIPLRKSLRTVVIARWVVTRQTSSPYSFQARCFVRYELRNCNPTISELSAVDGHPIGSIRIDTYPNTLPFSTPANSISWGTNVAGFFQPFNPNAIFMATSTLQHSLTVNEISYGHFLSKYVTLQRPNLVYGPLSSAADSFIATFPFNTPSTHNNSIIAWPYGSYFDTGIGQSPPVHFPYSYFVTRTQDETYWYRGNSDFVDKIGNTTYFNGFKRQHGPNNTTAAGVSLTYEPLMASVGNFFTEEYMCEAALNSSTNTFVADTVYVNATTDALAGCPVYRFGMQKRAWSVQDSPPGVYGVVNAHCVVQSEWIYDLYPATNRSCTCEQWLNHTGVWETQWSPWSNCTIAAPSSNSLYTCQYATCSQYRTVLPNATCDCGLGPNNLCSFTTNYTQTRACDCSLSLCRQDCVVGNWTDSGVCSTNCGFGNLTQTRPIIVAPNANGDPCPSLSRAIQCFASACNTSCTTSPWVTASECTPSCVPLGSNATQTQFQTRTIVDAGSFCNATLSQTVACSPTIYCSGDNTPQQNSVFSRNCDPGEIPVKNVDGRYTCFTDCPSSGADTSWPQFWPCRTQCADVTKSTACPAYATLCYNEYSTSSLISAYQQPVFIGPSTINCVVNFTRLCSASEMISLCGETVANCFVTTFANGSSPVFAVNCTQTAASYGSFLSVTGCSAAQLRKSCYVDPTKCRIVTDVSGVDVQLVDCPWGENLIADSATDVRIPPSTYVSPLSGTCTDDETINQCGQTWANEPYRQRCQKTLAVFSEWYGHTFTYDTSAGCTLDVCQDAVASNWLCRDGPYSPLCLQSDISSCLPYNNSQSCKTCVYSRDATFLPSRRCYSNELTASPCARCRMIKSSSDSAAPFVMETDCGMYLTVYATDPLSQRQIGSLPAAVGWNRRLISGTFFRNCTAIETASLCGVGTWIHADDPVWRFKRCGLIGNPAYSIYVPALHNTGVTIQTPAGCQIQNVLSETLQLTSTLCHTYGSWMPSPYCPTDAELSASAAGNNSLEAYLLSFNRASADFIANYTARGQSRQMAVRHCSQSEWLGAASCARFHSECRVVLNYPTASGSPSLRVQEHKCWYTSNTGWETSIYTRVCTPTELNSTCTTDPLRCRVVYTNSSRTVGKRFVMCPNTTFFSEQLTDPGIYECTPAESASFCPADTLSALNQTWDIGNYGNYNSTNCAKTACTRDSNGNLSNCTMISGSCQQRSCSPAEQQALCGGYTHQCSVGCRNGTDPYRCRQVGACGTVFSVTPVRRCNYAEWQNSCADTFNDCRVQCDDTGFTTGCVKTFSCASRRGGDSSYSGSTLYPATTQVATLADTVAQCGAGAVTPCIYSNCSFTHASAVETCACKASTCNCPVSYAQYGKPCNASFFYGKCSTHDALVNTQQLCGQFVVDCVANCTGAWTSPSCSSVNCVCTDKSFAWGGKPCAGYEVPCSGPVNSACGSNAVGCSRVVSPSFYTTTVQTSIDSVSYSDTPTAYDYWRCYCANGTVAQGDPLLSQSERDALCGTPTTCNTTEALATCGLSTATCNKNAAGVPVASTCRCPVSAAVYSVEVSPGVTKCFSITNGTLVSCTYAQLIDCSQPASYCRQQCINGVCTRLNSTCLSETSGSLRCDFDLANHICGSNFHRKFSRDASGFYPTWACSINGSYRPDIGYFNLNSSTAFCNCSSTVLISGSTNEGTVIPAWYNDYGRCADHTSVVRSCTASETSLYCPSTSLSQGLVPRTGFDGSRYRDTCLLFTYNQSLVPWSCPYQQVVRQCNAREVFRYCPEETIVANVFPHCMVECNPFGDLDKDCRLFGECATQIPQASCSLYCPQSAGLQCTGATIIRQQTENGITFKAEQGSCLYPCPLIGGGVTSCTGADVYVNCSVADQLATCGDVNQVSGCWQTIGGGGVDRQCTCLPGWGNPNPSFTVTNNTSTGDITAVAVVARYPICSGQIVACPSSMVSDILGPYGASCFMTQRSWNDYENNRVVNYTCRANGQYQTMTATQNGAATPTSQSTSIGTALMPYIDRPCGINYIDRTVNTANVTEVTLQNSFCGTGVLLSTVRVVYSDSGSIATKSIVPGSCVCTKSVLSYGMDYGCNSTYFYSPCSDADYAALPTDLTHRDCRTSSPASRESYALAFPDTTVYPYANPNSFTQARIFRMLYLSNNSAVSCTNYRGNECTIVPPVVLVSDYPTAEERCFKSTSSSSVRIPCTQRVIYFATSTTTPDVNYIGDKVVCQSMTGGLCANETFPVPKVTWTSGAWRIECYKTDVTGFRKRIACFGKPWAYERRMFFNNTGWVVCDLWMGILCKAQPGGTPLYSFNAAARKCYRINSNGDEVQMPCVYRTILASPMPIECDDMLSSLCGAPAGPPNYKFDYWTMPWTDFTCYKVALDGVTITTSWCTTINTTDSAGKQINWPSTNSYPLTADRIWTVLYNSGPFQCDNDAGDIICMQRRLSGGGLWTIWPQYNENNDWCYQGSLTGPMTVVTCAFTQIIVQYSTWGMQYVRCQIPYTELSVNTTETQGNAPARTRFCSAANWFLAGAHPAGHIPAGSVWFITSNTSVVLWAYPPAPATVQWGYGFGYPLFNPYARFSGMYYNMSGTVYLVLCTYVSQPGGYHLTWRGEMGNMGICLADWTGTQRLLRDAYQVNNQPRVECGYYAWDPSTFAVTRVDQPCKWREAVFNINNVLVTVICDVMVGDVCFQGATPIGYILPAGTDVWLAGGRQYSISGIPPGLYTLSGKLPGSINTAPALAVNCKTMQWWRGFANDTVSCSPVMDFTTPTKPFPRTADNVNFWSYTSKRYRVLNFQEGQVLCDADRFDGDYCTAWINTDGTMTYIYTTNAIGQECWQGSINGQPTRIPCTFRLNSYVYEGATSIAGFPLTGAGDIACSYTSPSGVCQNKICTDCYPARPSTNYTNADSLHSVAMQEFGPTGQGRVQTTFTRRVAYFPRLATWIECDSTVGEWCVSSPQTGYWSVQMSSDIRCLSTTSDSTDTEIQCPEAPNGWPAPFSPSSVASTPMFFKKSDCVWKMDAYSLKATGLKPHACLDTYFDGAQCSQTNAVAGCGAFVDDCFGRCMYPSAVTASGTITQTCASISTCTCLQPVNRVFGGALGLPCEQDFGLVQTTNSSICTPLCGSGTVGCQARCKMSASTGQITSCISAAYCLCANDVGFNNLGRFSATQTLWESCNAVQTYDSCAPSEGGCGIYTESVTRNCRPGSRSASDCLHYCKCYDGTTTIPGTSIPCSGYIRQCNTVEIPHYCSTVSTSIAFSACTLVCNKTTSAYGNETCVLNPGSCLAPSVSSAQTGVLVLSEAPAGTTWKGCNATESQVYCGKGALACRVDSVSRAFILGSCICDLVNGAMMSVQRTWNYPPDVYLVGTAIPTPSDSGWLSFTNAVQSQITLRGSDSIVAVTNSPQECTAAGGAGTIRIRSYFYQCMCDGTAAGDVQYFSNELHNSWVNCTFTPTIATALRTRSFSTDADLMNSCHGGIRNRTITGNWYKLIAPPYMYQNQARLLRPPLDPKVQIFEPYGYIPPELQTNGDVEDYADSASAWDAGLHDPFFDVGEQKNVPLQGMNSTGYILLPNETRSTYVDYPMTRGHSKFGWWYRACYYIPRWAYNWPDGSYTPDNRPPARPAYPSASDAGAMCACGTFYDCVAPSGRRYVSTLPTPNSFYTRPNVVGGGACTDDSAMQSIVPPRVCPVGWTTVPVRCPRQELEYCENWFMTVPTAGYVNIDDGDNTFAPLPGNQLWWSTTARQDFGYSLDYYTGHTTWSADSNMWKYIKTQVYNLYTSIPPKFTAFTRRFKSTPAYKHPNRLRGDSVPVSRVLEPHAIEPTNPFYNMTGVDPIYYSGVSAAQMEPKVYWDCQLSVSQCETLRNRNPDFPLPGCRPSTSGVNSWYDAYWSLSLPEKAFTMQARNRHQSDVPDKGRNPFTMQTTTWYNTYTPYDITYNVPLQSVYLIDVTPGDPPGGYGAMQCSWTWEDPAVDGYVSSTVLHRLDDSKYLCIAYGTSGSSDSTCNLADSVSSRACDVTYDDNNKQYAVGCTPLSGGCRNREAWASTILDPSAPDFASTVTSDGKLAPSHYGSIYNSLQECLCPVSFMRPYMDDNLKWSSILDGYAFPRYAELLSVASTTPSLIYSVTSTTRSLTNGTCWYPLLDTTFAGGPMTLLRRVFYSSYTYNFVFFEPCLGRGYVANYTINGTQFYNLSAPCICTPGFTGISCEKVNSTNLPIQNITGCSAAAELPCGIGVVTNGQTVNLADGGTNYYFKQVTWSTNFYTTPLSVLRAACANGTFDWHTGRCSCDAGFITDSFTGKCTISPCGSCNGRGACSAVDGSGFATCICTQPDLWTGAHCEIDIQAVMCGSAGCGYNDGRGKCVLKADGGYGCRCSSWETGYMNGTYCQIAYLDASRAAQCAINYGTAVYGGPLVGVYCNCSVASFTGPVCQYSRCPVTYQDHVNGVYSHQCSLAGSCVQPYQGAEIWSCRCASNDTAGCACDAQLTASSYCGSSMCSGHGTCTYMWSSTQQRNYYGCQCDSGRRGSLCEISVCAPLDNSPLPSGGVCNGFDCGTSLSLSQCNCGPRYFNGIYKLAKGTQCQTDVTDACVLQTAITGNIAQECSGMGTCSCSGTVTPFDGACTNGNYSCVCRTGASGKYCNINDCVAVDVTCGGATVGECSAPGATYSTIGRHVCNCLYPWLWTKSSETGSCTVNACALGGRVNAVPDLKSRQCVCPNPLLMYTTDYKTSCKSSICPVDPTSGSVCGQRYSFDITSDPSYLPGADAKLYNTLGVSCVAASIPNANGTCQCRRSYGYDYAGTICVPLCDINGTAQVLAINQDPAYQCVCKAGRGGSTCSEPYCLNNGTYDYTLGTCSCPAAFKGTRCETVACVGGTLPNTTDYSRCVCSAANTTGALCDAVCQNGGYGTPMLTCSCPQIWTGDKCQTSRCVNGVPNLSNYTCTCNQNFRGAFCDSCTAGWSGALCNHNDCNNGSPVAGPNSSFTCTCDPHWVGTYCNTSCAPLLTGADCMTTLCRNGGSTNLATYQCSCPTNAGGPLGLCECIRPNCSNGGVANFCDTNCSCTAPWWGGTLCADPVNPCNNSAAGSVFDYNTLSCVCGRITDSQSVTTYRFTGTWCGTADIVCYNGTKINTTDCACGFGYAGPHCWNRTNPCLNNGSVDYSTNPAHCSCPPPFAGALCENNTHPCYHGGVFNTSAMTCDCSSVPNGTWIGDYCDVVYQPGSRCRNNAYYNSTSDQCQCTSYWTDANCTTWSLPCLNNGTSVNNSAITNCNCPLAYEGQFCQSFRNLCANGGSVSQLDGSCTCTSHWTGRWCTDWYLPCQHNGTAANSSSVTACQCPYPWTGTLCEMLVNDCANGGSINQTTGVCNCTSFWNGTKCTDWALPCQNGGTYTNDSSQTACQCPYNRTGLFCENFKNLCSNTSTFNSNDGSCLCDNDGVNTFWTGEYCTNWTVPCLFGGTYASGVPNCSCPADREGQFCESRKNICLNGGQIDNGTGVCYCPPLWTGSLCQTFVNPCPPNATWSSYLCPATGCRFADDGQCICPIGWMGQWCNDKQPLAKPISCNGRGYFNGYACTCNYPFTGVGCLDNICRVNFVNAYLDCYAGANACKCSCLPGFGGADCGTTVDPTVAMAIHTCQNGGVYNPISNACDCGDPNFAGPRCELRVCGIHGSMSTNSFQSTCVCNTSLSGSAALLSTRACSDTVLLSGKCSNVTGMATYTVSVSQCICDSGYSFDNSSTTQCNTPTKDCGVNSAPVPQNAICACASPKQVSSRTGKCVLPCVNGAYNTLTDYCVCFSTDYFGRLCEKSRSAILAADAASRSSSIAASAASASLTSSTTAFSTPAGLCGSGASGCGIDLTPTAVVSVRAAVSASPTSSMSCLSEPVCAGGLGTSQCSCSIAVPEPTPPFPQPIVVASQQAGSSSKIAAWLVALIVILSITALVLFVGALWMWIRRRRSRPSAL